MVTMIQRGHAVLPEILPGPATQKILIAIGNNNYNDKKCINKEERVRHLPGYCPQTSQENKDAEER